MKFKNCVVGQRVKVKNSTVPYGDNPTDTFSSVYIGLEGVIIDTDSHSKDGLSVYVEFEDGTDWGNHKDLKMLKGDGDVTSE